jgi:hypothetical protein
MSYQTSPVRRLTCSCCGEDAGRWHQHWNMDTGFGACVRCITSMRGRETEAEIHSRYGIDGINWGMNITAFGRTYRVVAAFSSGERKRADDWMLKHPTHAPLGFHEDLLLLGHIYDGGIKPAASTPLASLMPISYERKFPFRMSTSHPEYDHLNDEQVLACALAEQEHANADDRYYRARLQRIDDELCSRGLRVRALNKENNALSPLLIRRTIVEALQIAAHVYEAAKKFRACIDACEMLLRLENCTLLLIQGALAGADRQTELLVAEALREAAAVYRERAAEGADAEQQLARAEEAWACQTQFDRDILHVIQTSTES